MWIKIVLVMVILTAGFLIREVQLYLRQKKTQIKDIGFVSCPTKDVSNQLINLANQTTFEVYNAHYWFKLVPFSSFTLTSICSRIAKEVGELTSQFLLSIDRMYFYKRNLTLSRQWIHITPPTGAYTFAIISLSKDLCLRYDQKEIKVLQSTLLTYKGQSNNREISFVGNMCAVVFLCEVYVHNF